MSLTTSPTTHAPPRLRRLLLAPLAALLAVALVAGCGSSHGHGSDSAKPKNLSHDSHFGTTLYEGMKKAKTFHVDVSSSASGQKIAGSGDGDISGSKPAVKVSIKAGNDKLDSIYTDGLFYLKGGGLAPNDKWLKVDPSDKSGLGAMLGALGANVDPTKSLTMMNGAAKVTKVGEQKIDGADTFKYDVQVPRDNLVKVLGFPQQIAGMLPATIPYTIWVDGENRVRRTDSVLTAAGQKVVSSQRFSKFGEKVSIQAPPAAQVTDKAPNLPGLSSQGGSGGASPAPVP